MKKLVEITDFFAPELDVYVRLTGAQLKNKLSPDNAIFIAESPTVIEVALNAGCEPVSFLTDKRLLNETMLSLFERAPDAPVYVAEREVLTRLTGFELTRGALSAMRRPKEKDAKELIKNAKRIAVFENVTDSTNIGALFRSAAAFEIDAVLVTPSCCDPLSRRAVRVSMGTVFQVPFAKIGERPEDWPIPSMDFLKENGFKTVAMALSDNSVFIDDKKLLSEDRLAIILGTEGTGLLKETVSSADYVAKIPMAHGVDSLNVAAAGAVAFYQLTRKPQ